MVHDNTTHAGSLSLSAVARFASRHAMSVLVTLRLPYWARREWPWRGAATSLTG